MNTRRKSALATVEKISPNKTVPRTGPVRRLTPHCVAGNCTVETTLGIAAFQAGGGASTNYAIGSDGRIGLGVEETNRPWTTSSSVNDHEAITFEIANNGGSPDWTMSDAAINAWLNLAVETAQFYGFKKVSYHEKPDSITIANVETWIKTWAKDGEMIITLHCWYKNKTCPGPYFMRQIPWLVSEINRRLNGSAATLFTSGSSTVVTAPASDTVSSGSCNYTVRITAQALNVRKGPGTDYQPPVRTLVNDKNLYTIVEESTGKGATKWGRLKSGLGWISLDYTIKS